MKRFESDCCGEDWAANSVLRPLRQLGNIRYKFFDSFWVADRKVQADDSTVAPADNANLFDVQMIEKFEHVI